MSMTKREFHDDICAMIGDFDDAEFWMVPEIDETEIDWFPDRRIAHDGYGESGPSVSPVISDDDLPF